MLGFVLSGLSFLGLCRVYDLACLGTAGTMPRAKNSNAGLVRYPSNTHLCSLGSSIQERHYSNKYPGRDSIFENCLVIGMKYATHFL